MLFDLTPKIILKKKDQKKYLYFRAVLFVSAFIFAVFSVFTIIFPTRYFSFSFLNSNSLANTIVNPRDGSGNLPDHGKMSKDSDITFDSSLLGVFSDAKIIFRLNKKSSDITGEKITVKKSYRAFLYPENGLFGFKDGTLLKNLENYYIISDGKLRKFKSKSMLLSMGFNADSFEDVSVDDLIYNALGEDITNANVYPNNSIFKSGADYFILTNGKLVKFISEKAYLSQYSVKQAIEKTIDFLQGYPQNENLIGFADGSLIAYGESAYVASGNKAFPINNVITFEAMGYKWNDIIMIGGDEMSFYEKEKLLDISGAHPDGTIFLASDNTGQNKWYIIKDKKKYSLPTENIASSWSKIEPIKVSAESLISFSECSFGEKWFFSKTYSCKMAIDNLQNLLGKDYEFNVIFNEDIKVDIAELQFKKSYTISNLKRFAASVIKNIKNNYAGQQ